MEYILTSEPQTPETMVLAPLPGTRSYIALKLLSQLLIKEQRYIALMIFQIKKT